MTLYVIDIKAAVRSYYSIINRHKEDLKMKFYIFNPVDGSSAVKYHSLQDLQKVNNISDYDWDMIKIKTYDSFRSCNYVDTHSEFVGYANYFLDALNRYLNTREFESPYGSYQYTLVNLEEDYLEL